MRKAHVFNQGSTTSVCCTVGHTSVASFMCLTHEGALLVAGAFQARGAAAAALVYQTIFSQELSTMFAAESA